MKKIIKPLIFLLVAIEMLCGGYLLAQKTNNTEIEYNDDTAQFIHETPDRVMSLLEERQPGIYYFGFPKCAWCQELLPVLDRVLEENNLKAYATNTRADDYTSEDNIKLEELFIENTSEKRLTVPFLIKITNDCKIETHIGTIKDHDATLNKLTKEQTEQLATQLEEFINK